MPSLIQQAGLPPADKAYITIQESSSDTSSVPQDGLSCYRAIARLYTGDPKDAKLVMNAVLDHYMRVLANKRHPLNKQYQEYERRPREDGEKPLFTILACPDLCTAARGFRDLMTVIANGLRIQLSLWKGISLSKIIFEGRMVSTPETNIAVCGEESTGLCSYGSVLQEEGGKSLVDYLLEAKRTVKTPLRTRKPLRDLSLGNLQLRELRWWWDPPSASDMGINPQCWNEYRLPNEDPPPQVSKMESFCVFAVGVKTSRDIRPAVQLILEALARAPGQQVSVASESDPSSPQRLRPYVGIDAEFVRRSTPHGFVWSPDPTIRAAQENDSPELMCSVLSIAVDKYLCVNFHLLEMLENPDDLTVREITFLFREIILNKYILKIWFNYQSDIPVLDSTIAHLYQLSARPHYTRRKSYHDPELVTVWPTFKIADPRYNNRRPQDLFFNGYYADPVDTNCPFHNTDLSPQGIGCPCGTGNLDIVHIIEFISTKINLPGAANGAKLVPKSWAVARTHGNYANYLIWLLGDQDRLYPLLKYFKDAPSRAHEGIQLFYDQLGSGMETNSEKMGYCIGDVVGIALIMRFLTTTGDRKLLASRLFSARMGALVDSTRRACPPGHSIAPAAGGIPLIVDYPKSWNFEPLAGKRRVTTDPSTQYWIADTLPDDFEADPGVFRDGERCGSFHSTSYIEHEKRCAAQVSALARVTTPRAPRLSPYHYEPLVQDQIRRHQARFFAHGYLFDACKFQLPSLCTVRDTNKPRKLWKSFPPPVIRAGTSHTADLVELIVSQGASAPCGFLANPDSKIGLPAALLRRPGDSLDYVSIEKAYSGKISKPVGSGKDTLAAPIFYEDINPAIRPEQLTEPPPSVYAPTHKEFYDQEMARGSWLANAVPLIQDLRQRLEEQKTKLEQEGEPFEAFLEDIYDPDGRQYSRAVKATPNWNRPLKWSQRQPFDLWETMYGRLLRDANEMIIRNISSHPRDLIWDQLYGSIGPGPGLPPPAAPLAAPPVPRRVSRRTGGHRRSSNLLHKVMSNLPKRRWSSISSSDEDELPSASIVPSVSNREIAQGAKRRVPSAKRLQAARSTKKTTFLAQSERITRKMAREHKEATATVQSDTTCKRKVGNTVINENKGSVSKRARKRVKVSN